MAYEDKKMTAPILSAASDREQPTLYNNDIIPNPDENDNSSDDWESFFLQMQKMSDPAYMHTVSLSELYEQVYASRPPLIDGLLCSGTYLFVGAPKMGKSFLMAQLAYHVSLGKPLWGYAKSQSVV